MCLSVLVSGQWRNNLPIPTCNPRCHIRSSTTAPQVSNSQRTKKAERTRKVDERRQQKSARNTYYSERYLVAVAISVFIWIGWNARLRGRRLGRNSEADTRATQTRGYGRLFAINHDGCVSLLSLRLGGLGSSSLLPLLWYLG